MRNHLGGNYLGTTASRPEITVLFIFPSRPNFPPKRTSSPVSLFYLSIFSSGILVVIPNRPCHGPTKPSVTFHVSLKVLYPGEPVVKVQSAFEGMFAPVRNVAE